MPHSWRSDLIVNWHELKPRSHQLTRRWEFARSSDNRTRADEYQNAGPSSQKNGGRERPPQKGEKSALYLAGACSAAGSASTAVNGLLSPNENKIISAHMVPPARTNPMKKRIVQKTLSHLRCMK